MSCGRETVGGVSRSRKGDPGVPDKAQGGHDSASRERDGLRDGTWDAGDELDAGAGPVQKPRPPDGP